MRLTKPTEQIHAGQRYMLPSGRTAIVHDVYKNFLKKNEVTLRYEQTQIKGQGEYVNFSENNVRKICYRLSDKPTQDTK